MYPRRYKQTLFLSPDTLKKNSSYTNPVMHKERMQGDADSSHLPHSKYSCACAPSAATGVLCIAAMMLGLRASVV